VGHAISELQTCSNGQILVVIGGEWQCVSASSIGGVCYTSYSGSCASGFSRKLTLGDWGVCGHATNVNTLTHYSPPGGGCLGQGSYSVKLYKIGSAVLCCQN
jgi:hypothetical protein